MKKGLRPGVFVEHRALVRPWMRPHLEGLVSHRLYSTWAMVYHMEVAARRLLAPFLERQEEAVGGAVSVKHLRPALLGETVLVRCTLDRVSGPRVHTRLNVFAGRKKIGEGKHLQVVMSRERFKRLSLKKNEDGP